MRVKSILDYFGRVLSGTCARMPLWYRIARCVRASLGPIAYKRRLVAEDARTRGRGKRGRTGCFRSIKRGLVESGQVAHAVVRLGGLTGVCYHWPWDCNARCNWRAIVDGWLGVISTLIPMSLPIACNVPMSITVR